MSVNILDGFAGLGGFSLAMQRAGIEIDKHYFSEVDKYAEQIYRKQFPGAIRLGDITKIGNEHGKIDIITGGFPCQSFSIAGKRGGFSDTRGTLFFEIERLARFYKPSYMVLENVKGLFSHDGGNTVRVILDKLRGLNYSVQLLLLNTVDFGIPQNRERVFFICTLGEKPRPEISSIRERKTETPFSSNAIDANYYKGIDNHGQRTCIQINNDVERSEAHRVYDPAGNARTIKNGGGLGAKTGLYAVQAVLSPDRSEKRQNGRRFKDNGEPSFTLTGQDRHGIMITKKSQDRIIRNIQEHTANTLTSIMYKGSASNGMTNVIQDTIIRRLTPTECERLQDYPDNYTKIGINEKGEQVEISDTQRYKTLGNSISVIVAEEIFKAIKEVL